MEGIAGIWSEDPGAASLERVTRMLATLAHRGPVESPCWCGPRLTLGSRGSGLSTLERDGLVIVADARIDGAEAGSPSDGAWDARADDVERIAWSYRRFGPDCVERLSGDFAFALHDPARDRLLLARDGFGLRPLVYHHSSRLFAFASEIGALLTLDEVPDELDEWRIACFLEEITEDRAATVRRHVRRLPAGHALLLEHGRLRTWQTFHLSLPRERSASDRSEAAERFGALFTRSVERRLRAPDPLASMLSGGLDSSAVTCVAREMLARAGRPALHTYSLHFSATPRSDERAFIDAVLDQGGVRPALFDGDELEPYGGLVAAQPFPEEPTHGGNTSIYHAAYRLARQEGVTSVLDGLIGDAVVGYGLDLLLQSVLRGRWLRAWREAGAFARRVEGRRSRVLAHAVRYPLVETLLERGPACLRELRGWRRKRRGQDPDGLPGLAHPDLAARVDLRDRVRELRASADSPSLLRPGAADFRGLTDGRVEQAVNGVAHRAASYGIELRLPFLDVDLVRFCIGLPPEFRLEDGYNRRVLREALPVLPERVRWRDWKGDLSHGLRSGFLRFELPRVEQLLADERGPLAGWVHPGRVRAAIDQVRAGDRQESLLLLSKYLDLGLWLKGAGLS